MGLAEMEIQFNRFNGAAHAFFTCSEGRHGVAGCEMELPMTTGVEVFLGSKILCALF